MKSRTYTMNKMLFAAAAAALLVSCSSDSPTPPADLPDGNQIEVPEPADLSEYHQKTRTVPYPRIQNELFINPAPLIVPQNMKKKDLLQFELSSTADFAAGTTEMSEPLEWNMWNCHHALKPGRWYWRFRDVNLLGGTGSWSETYSFEVKGTETEFVTPEWSKFAQNVPSGTNRIYCYVNDRLADARRTASSHPEYASLLSRAKASVKVDYNTRLSTLYANHEQLYQHVEQLGQAYLLTGDISYADKLKALLQAMIDKPCSTSALSDNFTRSGVAYAHAAVLDLLGDNLPASLAESARQFVGAQVKYFYSRSIGYEENHIFDNHFWQMNMRRMFGAALVLYERSEYPEAAKLVEYIYELWTARAPASGFNRDGVWHNGTSYFATNAKTLAYMPLLLGHVTGADFTAHPWYMNAGRALAYTIPASGENPGFGDGSEKRTSTTRAVASFADFLARTTGDSYASWYATTCIDLVHDDWDMRLYRMCNSGSYTGTKPVNTPLLTWYRDAGEVTMHSDLTNVSSDLSIGFRSSQYGSGSHTTASQNAFNLLYGGKVVFRSSGYYQNFSDAHNLLSYRHSRAHNTILVNGIGQPYDVRAYGRILRAGCTSGMAYALGDASHAYCGITEDPMWVENFRKAGVEQSVANGFGNTPLTRYYRHVAMVEPGVMVIYDELEASQAACWDWLLHSPVQFNIDKTAGTLTTENTAAGVRCRVTLMTSSDADLSQTSRFFQPPATTGPDYPDQWHFTARIDGKERVRVLAVIQPVSRSQRFTDVKTAGDGVWTMGDWTITAEMNPADAPHLSLVNTVTGAVLDAGSAEEVKGADGAVIPRRYSRSTILSEAGTRLELIDSSSPTTRRL